MEILRAIFVLPNMPRGLPRKTTIWGSQQDQTLKESKAFADGDFVLKSDITFSGLTIAKVHFNCEKVSSFFIFIFLIYLA